MPWTFIVVQILLWIALSTWFGAVLFVAIAPTLAMHVAGVTVHAALAALEQLTGSTRG